MQLAVIGTGYVGLVVGAGFADHGNHVTCVDIDARRIAGLERGVIPIHEPGLQTLVVRNHAAGRLSFTTDTALAVARADVVFLAVPTPSDRRGGADLSYVEDAVRAVGRAIRGFTVIVMKSTVPVGTAARVRAILAETAAHEYAVASNPEFLKEGAAVRDFMRPDRVVLGVDDPRAERMLRNLYAAILRTDDRIHIMDVASAELTKYAANAMLAVRIAFMNEMAGLAERVGADIEPIRRALGADPRIGRHFLFPGPGFGGSCLPKDVRALAASARDAGQTLRVVEAAEAANQQHRAALGDLLAQTCGELAGRRIALWGLAFKADTDDVRETAALPLIGYLRERGATVIGYDPAAMETMRAAIGDDIEYAADEYAAAVCADALVVLTDWKQFRSPDFRRLVRDMAQPVVLDARNLWDPEEVRSHGFRYRGIGRR